MQILTKICFSAVRAGARLAAVDPIFGALICGKLCPGCAKRLCEIFAQPSPEALMSRDLAGQARGQSLMGCERTEPVVRSDAREAGRVTERRTLRQHLVSLADANLGFGPRIKKPVN